MWRCNDELRARADELHRTSKRDVKHYIGIFFLQILFSAFEILVSDTLTTVFWIVLLSFDFILRKLARENYDLYTPTPVRLSG